MSSTLKIGALLLILGLEAAQPRAACASDDALTLALGAEVERYVEADRAARPATCEVLFVGSSSIVLWKDSLAADMAPIPVINRGFGGSHIEHVNRWFNELVAPYRPRAIVFYAGDNDIDAGKSVERVVADFETQVNEAIRARAGKRKDILYIDVAGPMLQNGKPRDLFTEDGLHMSARGYAIWTVAVRAAMLPHTNADEENCRLHDKR